MKLVNTLTEEVDFLCQQLMTKKYDRHIVSDRTKYFLVKVEKIICFYLLVLKWQVKIL